MKSIYFTANKHVMTKDGQPVQIGGVMCLFRRGRHYEIPVRGNEKLVEAIEVGCENGDFSKLPEVRGAQLVREQDEETRRQRDAKSVRRRGNNVTAPRGVASAKVE